MLDAPFKAVLANGAPEQDFLEQVFGHILQFGTLPWQPAGGSVQEGAMPLAAESLLGAQVEPPFYTCAPAPLYLHLCTCTSLPAPLRVDLHLHLGDGE